MIPAPTKPPPRPTKVSKAMGWTKAMVTASVSRPVAMRAPARRRGFPGARRGGSRLWAPELLLRKLADVMHHVVAAAGDAGERSGGEQAHHGAVGGIFLELASAGVTVQAGLVIEGLVEVDGFHGGAEVLHPDVMEPLELSLQGAELRVVGVAGVTGGIGGHEMVLEVDGGNIASIGDI